MTPVQSITMQALHRFLNPQDIVSAYQRCSFYEIITGMHPFKLTISSTGLLKMKLSPIGFVISCLHLLAIGYAFIVVMTTVDQPVTIFMDSVLAQTQTAWLQWVQSLNTFLIFFCNFVYYDRDRILISKLQLVVNHMEAIGLNMTTFYRQAVRSLFLVFILVILVLVGLWVEGVYFYSRVIDEKYFIFYGISFVMPPIYVQVQLVQFIILSTFQIVLSKQLNAMLLKILSAAVEEDGTDTE